MGFETIYGLKYDHSIHKTTKISGAVFKYKFSGGDEFSSTFLNKMDFSNYIYEIPFLKFLYGEIILTTFSSIRNLILPENLWPNIKP